MSTSSAERSVSIVAELETAREALIAAEREAKRELGEVAGAEALGEIATEQARQKRDAIANGLAAKRERVDTLAAAVTEIERRMQAEADKAHEAELGAAAKKLANALKARSSAGKNLARAVGDVERSAAELARHRTAVDRAAEAYRATLHDGEAFTWPSDADEPWSIADDALALLADGPIRPVADLETTREANQATRARQDAEAIASFALWPTAAMLGTLPEHLYDDARRILAENQAKASERWRAREERTAERRFARIGKEVRSRPPVA